MGESNHLLSVKCIEIEKKNSLKYHYGNTICIKMKITKAIHDKPKPNM